MEAWVKPAREPAVSVIETVQREILDPTFSRLLPAYDSPRARVMLLAIGLQESLLTHRWQVVDPKHPDRMGPARGLWQFERGGGVRGVLNYRTTRLPARGVCEVRGVPPTERAVYDVLHKDDLLACAFARLLLWTDPKPLPTPQDAAGAFALYLRTWRPGAYTRGSQPQRDKLEAKFRRNHAKACEAAA